MTAALRLLLGPQRPKVNLLQAMQAAEFAPRSLAVISAAWQEAEADIDDVRGILGLPLEDLALYERAAGIFRDDPDFEAVYRARQDQLREQQRLYRLRLRQLAIATRHTLRAEGDAEMIAAEQRHAIAQLCALDRHHLRRTERLQQRFEKTHGHRVEERVEQHAGQIREILGRHDGLLITGGNIVVLMNRLRLFGVRSMLDAVPIVAWSAGAMALTDRIVLFHDRMPQGRRDAEVLGAGLGILPDHVVLPDTANRLRHGDRLRVGLMSRRFAPDTCIALDNDSAVAFRGDEILASPGARRIDSRGRFSRVHTS